jgi:hypothetical protein
MNGGMPSKLIFFLPFIGRFFYGVFFKLSLKLSLTLVI